MWEDVEVPEAAPANGPGSKRKQDGANGGANGAKRRRAYDYFDAHIDQGHVRKTKANKAERMAERMQATASWFQKAKSGKRKG